MKRFGLSAEERIKSRKDFETIFSKGKTIFSSDKRIKAIYFLEKNDDTSGVKISATVSKKAGKAVWRNRVKRLIKEAYRLKKEEIEKTVYEKDFLLKIVFSLYTFTEKKNKKIYLSEVMPGMTEILIKLKKTM